MPWAVWLMEPLLGLHLTRSVCQGLLHISHLIHTTPCTSKIPSGIGPKYLQDTHEPGIWHVFQVKNTSYIRYKSTRYQNSWENSNLTDLTKFHCTKAFCFFSLLYKDAGNICNRMGTVISYVGRNSHAGEESK